MNAKNPGDRVPATLDFKYSAVIGGAIAAVVAAVIGSRLGVAGTLIGAAVTSLVVGATAQVATFGVARSHERIQRVASRRRPDGGPAEPQGTSAMLDASPDEGSAAGGGSWPAGRRRFGPGVVLAGVLGTAAAIFVIGGSRRTSLNA